MIRELWARTLWAFKDEGGWVAAGVIVAAVAAVGSAYAQYEQSQQQAKMAEYQGKVARNQAEAARQAAAIAADNQQEEDRRTIAAMRARIGQAGVLGDVGSPLLSLMDAEETAALNQARIAWSGDTEAAAHFAEEQGLRFQAKATRRLGYLGAGVSLLGGASSAASAYGKKGGGDNPPAGGGRTGRWNLSQSSGYGAYRSGER